MVRKRCIRFLDFETSLYPPDLIKRIRTDQNLQVPSPAKGNQHRHLTQNWAVTVKSNPKLNVCGGGGLIDKRV